MNNLKLFLQKYFIYLLLFFYGFFYHISSSEFWPVSISKTWFDLNNFEYSLFQKPLFSLFLSFFHLIPLTDAQHLYSVKAVFSFFGVLSLWFYVSLIFEIAQFKPTRLQKALLTLFILIVSPVFLNNFFRIRTDQVSFFVSLAYLHFLSKKKYTLSLFFMFLLPLISIKSIFFVILLMPYFYIQIKNYLTKKHFLYIALISLTIGVWIIALNTTSIYYFIDSYSLKNYSNIFIKDYINRELFVLLLALLVSIYNIYTKKFILLSAMSLISLFIVFASPQSYPYFIASFVFYIYLPFFVFVVQYLKESSKIPLFIVTLAASYSIFINNSLFLNSFKNNNHLQFEYIKKSSNILNKYNLNYLDGMGILPRQKMITCYVSPGDESSNINCLNLIDSKIPDSIIITQRLFSLGSSNFDSIASEYTQFLPNLWIKNSKSAEIPKSIIDLNFSAVPIFIFNF